MSCELTKPKVAKVEKPPNMKSDKLRADWTPALKEILMYIVADYCTNKNIYVEGGIKSDLLGGL